MPASTLQKESEKKNECAIDGEEKKFCASRLFHAPKVQRQSVKKNIAQSMVAGTVQIKKKYNECFFSLCYKTGVRSVFFFYVFFPCFHLRVASLRISFCNRLEYSLFLICATRFLLILFSSLTCIHVHIHLHIYIYIRAASGLIISCIQPPGFVEVPFMVGMLCSIHSDIHVGIRSQASAYELFF